MRRFSAGVWLLLVVAGVALTARRGSAWNGPLCTPDGTSTLAVLTDGPALSAHNACSSPPPPALVPSPAAIVPEWVPEPQPVAGHDGVHAFQRFLEEREKGALREALLQLTVVESAFPRLADRFALLRGALRLELSEYDAAIADFLIARDSLDGEVRARSRVLRMEAKMLANHRDADAALVDLLQFYPALPDAPHLRFMLGQWNERQSDVQSAIRIYRDLYLTGPGTPIADKARARLEALREGGVPVRPFRPLGEVTRVEVLARRGPHTLAREEAARLLERGNLPEVLRNRVHLVAAKIARIEGRFDDASRHLTLGGRQGGQGDEDRERDLRRVENATRAARVAEQAAARRQIAGLRNGKPWVNVVPNRLLAIVRSAAGAGLTAELDEALRGLSRQRKLVPQVALEAAILASGVGSPALLAVLLEKAEAGRGQTAVAARYHRSRLAERTGNYALAERGYLATQQADRGETRWYALWSGLRLRYVREAMVCGCDPDEALSRGARGAAKSGVKTGSAGDAEPLPTLRELLDGAPAQEISGEAATIENEDVAGERRDEVPGAEADTGLTEAGEPALAELEQTLRDLGERFETSYPWFARAADLLQLGLQEEATNELHEAYLAWRDARGRAQRRSGIEAVFRGDQAPVVPVAPELRRDRRQLQGEALETLIAVASGLGDEGTAVALSGWERARTRPRPYPEVVAEAAARHDMDPNLLYAVMRTESVYQRRIVSYAGAIGLMQIMPRTGRHIAFALGREGYTTDDLLDPETNLDFAAWYLSSLIRRFDGHLPLAIASYNGGPHNVRSWLSQYQGEMTMEAFLERIPFTQTHRYVRRVLSHYAAYREQEGLPMVDLKGKLPALSADPVGF